MSLIERWQIYVCPRHLTVITPFSASRTCSECDESDEPEALVEFVPRARNRAGAVEAERDWLERILHADQRSDERVWATLANAADARLRALGGR